MILGREFRIRFINDRELRDSNFDLWVPGLSCRAIPYIDGDNQGKRVIKCHKYICYVGYIWKQETGYEYGGVGG